MNKKYLSNGWFAIYDKTLTDESMIYIGSEIPDIWDTIEIPFGVLRGIVVALEGMNKNCEKSIRPAC